MEELIRKVLNTLDKVEVKGKGNLDKLLGCMQALEKVANELAANRQAMAQASQSEVKNDVVSN